MKPPEGTRGKDIFYVPNYCDKCNKHFLIDPEFETHKRICLQIHIEHEFTLLF